MSKRYIIVVDMQNDFITGPLGSPEAVKAVENTRKLLEANHYERALFTRDTHYADYLETAEGKKLPVPHCKYGDAGWSVVADLIPYADIFINKETFGFVDWVEELEYWSFDPTEDTIEICGVCTDICVVSNALILKALYPEVPILVHASCCAGTSMAKHIDALNVMESCQITITD
jgi:nicotinamidase-related amidase